MTIISQSSKLEGDGVGASEGVGEEIGEGVGLQIFLLSRKK